MRLGFLLDRRLLSAAAQSLVDDLGLSAALGNYIKQWSEHFDRTAEFRSGEGTNERFPPPVETNLYRIVQEALNNCAKHSQCTRAEVLLERRDHHLVLIVADDGIGFDPDNVHHEGRRWGLLGMRERAALMNGTIEVESAPDKGTTIFVKVPIL